MKKQRLPRTPRVANWEMMAEINSLMNSVEVLKTETNLEKRAIYQNRFDEAQSNIRQFEAKMGY